GDAFASVSRSAACRWHCGRLARTAPSLFISALTKSASSICGKRLQPVDVWTSQERCPQAHRPTAATAKARLDKHPNNQPDVSPMSPNSVPLDPGPNRSVAGRGTQRPRPIHLERATACILLLIPSTRPKKSPHRPRLRCVQKNRRPSRLLHPSP